MPRLEFECQLSVPVDGYGVDDREPKPVIKLREGLSVLRQFEHKAANVLGLGFPLGLFRLELLQLGLGGLIRKATAGGGPTMASLDSLGNFNDTLRSYGPSRRTR